MALDDRTLPEIAAAERLMGRSHTENVTEDKVFFAEGQANRRAVVPSGLNCPMMATKKSRSEPA
jgi:hypothetical protein